MIPDNTVKLKIAFNGGFDIHEMMASKNIILQYSKEFVESFVENKSNYRIGSKSKKVIFENNMDYMQLVSFMKSLPSADKVEKDILSLNVRPPVNKIHEISLEIVKGEVQKLELKGLTRFSWISLYRFIFHNFEEKIKQKIKEKCFDEAIQSCEESIGQTYLLNDEEVLFYIFHQAGRGYQLYGIPKNIAKEINLEDYNQQEISGYENFMNVVEKYKLDAMASYNFH